MRSPSETPSRLFTPSQEDAGTHGTPSGTFSRRRRGSSQNLSPHNLSDEEPPEDDFNSPAFQRVFTDTRAMMSRMERTLGSSALHLEPDSTIRRLREKANELAQFHCPPTRTVGFVGDSGVGKSSLLNSLLDCEQLAHASNSSGTACTCAVTEYHYHGRDDFAIEVDLFDRQELRSQLTEMVQAYRRHHMRPPSTDKEEQEDIARRAQVAGHTFQNMFRGPNRLRGGRFVRGESEDVIIETMLQWAEELRPSDLSGRTVQPSREACTEFLIRLTSDSASSDTQTPLAWPYIKKIRVFLDAHILNKGLVLVDLPGLRDLNSARQNITERYILECDEIFAVSNIGRAVTDVGVTAVFDLARQVRLSNVGIVCTRSEEIQAHEVRNDWRGSGARTVQEYMDRLRATEEEIAAIEADLTDLETLEAEEGELLPGEIAEKNNLHARERVKRNAKKAQSFELDQYLITTRNEMVKERLLDLHKDAIPGGSLKVFCVSNTMYWKHREKPRDRSLPFLKLSGIIALRKHCAAMVAASQLRIATNYMDNDVRSLISSVELWVHSGGGTETAERKAVVRETLDVIEQRLRRDLGGSNSPFSRLARSFTDVFREQIYERRRIGQWIRGARDASDDWRGVSADFICLQRTTYIAFCGNYGNHYTSKVGPRNWNKEAMNSMVRDMKRPWDNFLALLTEERSAEIIASIEAVMDWAVEYLDNQLGEGDMAADALHQALESRQRLLVADVEDVCEVFESALKIIRADATSSHRTSLVGESMEGAYNMCRREGGAGSDARRKRIISSTLSDDSFFENIMKTLCRRFKGLATELQTGIQTAVETHLAAIRQTMDIVRDENVIAESERDGDFRRRVDEEVGRVRTELGGLERV
ncbi:hypothetical protein B0H66DRAFT_475296 [Apodospora peruviana]|uniref:Nuclear GTPase SLIP-GC n=1 Tax=Apodospora peruviana TaxID=516989 RepID=A0AAE0ID56_9PEZI|nr:hypothetical protein B0H66DRAFT_475296 [Apodospora peruviana]